MGRLLEVGGTAGRLPMVPRCTKTVALIAPAAHDLKGTGRYFVTMVTGPRRACLSIVRGEQAVEWSAAGRCVHQCLEEMVARYPIRIDCAVIMPDHIHVCFRVIAPLSVSVLRVLSGMRRVAEKLAASVLKETQLWEKRYRLFVACNYESYARCLAYTKANPKRWWLTRHQPCVFRARMVSHAALSAAFQWQAVGNLSLLEAPLILAVSIHRMDTPAQIAELTQRAIDVAEAGGVIVGGFVSPAERALLKCLYAAVLELKLILLKPHTLNGYKPPARVLDDFKAGRRLLLTSVPEHPMDAPCLREVCLRHNEVAHHLAGGGARRV